MTIQVTNTDYLLAAGQTLTSVDAGAISILVADGSFATTTIAGSVKVTASPQTLPPGQVSGDIAAVGTNGTSTFYGGQIVVNAGGSVVVDTTGSRHTASGIADLAGQEVLNFGLVRVVADQHALGIEVYTQTQPGGPSQVENVGTVDVTSTSSDAMGVLQMNGVSGENTGIIHVYGYTYAFGLQAESVSSYNNSGEIVVRTGLAGGMCIGADIIFSTGLHPTFTNSGHIDAVVALRMSSNLFLTGASANVVNSGQLVGEVDLAGSATVLTNAGTITGAITFTANNDTYDGRGGGTETGLVSGLGGDDTMLGGAGFDNFQGNQGNDSLSGGAGDDIVVGGKDNDVQFGDGGDDVVWGNLGNDTLDGGDGNDQVRGGQGDDSIAGGAGADYVSGDRGNDTISGGAGADLFHSFSGAGIDRVLDFNAGEGDRVMLDPGTTYTVSQVGADTVVDMGNGDQVVLVGVQLASLPNGWIFVG